MKKYIPLLLLLTACAGNEKKAEDKKAEQAATEQVQSDEARIDSMEKALQKQLDEVNEDSVLQSISN